jgi:hypothetical protein
MGRRAPKSLPNINKPDITKALGIKGKINLDALISSKKSEVADLSNNIVIKNSKNATWKERPPSPEEAIFGKNYLNCNEKEIFPKIIENLKILFSGEDYAPISEIFFFNAGFGAGKSTFAYLAEYYFLLWNLHLKSMCTFYGQMQGSKFAFMNVGPTANKAKDIVFSGLYTNVNKCKWFERNGFVIDPQVTSRIKFKGYPELEIMPAESSLKSAPTGFNLLFCGVDECAADDCFITKTEDLFQDIFYMVNNRRKSRFEYAACKGLVICTSTAGTEARYFEEFMFEAECRYKNEYKEFAKDRIKDTPISVPHGKVMIRRHPSWEVNPKYQPDIDAGHTFHISIMREDRKGEKIVYELDVPKSLEAEYRDNPERFLRNNASIPAMAISRFFKELDRIKENINRARVDPLPNPISPEGKLLPFYPNDAWQMLDGSFFADDDPSVRYYAHIDLATINDHVGLCVGHRGPDVTIDGVGFKTAIIDLSASFVSNGVKEIRIKDVKKFFINLLQKRGFQFRFNKITLDQYQSTETIQDFNSLGMLCEKKRPTVVSFNCLKELWYGQRLDIFYDNQLLWEAERLEDKGTVIEKSIGATDDEIECVARVVEEILAGDAPEAPPRPRVAKGIIGVGGFNELANRGESSKPQRAGRGNIRPRSGGGMGII